VSRVKQVQEARRIATIKNKNDLFLRRIKKTTKDLKAPTVVNKTLPAQLGSFKSSLERQHKRQTKADLEAA
jgi:hypothetical protein